MKFEYMIEADGEDNHGGIFSLTTGFSLLTCPPHGTKPKLVKKFGEWNESVENIANYPIHYAAKNNKIFITASSDVRCNITSTLFFISSELSESNLNIKLSNVFDKIVSLYLGFPIEQADGIL